MLASFFAKCLLQLPDARLQTSNEQSAPKFIATRAYSTGARGRFFSNLPLHTHQDASSSGLLFQILSAYSPIVRSAENGPMAATLRRAMTDQASLFW